MLPYLPGVLVDVDSDDDGAAVVVRADGLLDFASWFVYGDTLAIGFFCEFSADLADWNSDDHVFEGAGAAAVAVTACV